MNSVSTSWTAAIAALHERIESVFDALLERARLDEARLRRAPEGGGWSGIEVLEHVALTDRFLLVLADKIARKSLSRAARGDAWPASAPSFAHLEHIAGRELEWRAPEHMRPTGAVELETIARTLESDRERAFALLEQCPDGVGTLHRIRMSVVGGEDDRLELYQYLEVLRLHAERHVRQLDRVLGTPSARAQGE